MPKIHGGKAVVPTTDEIKRLLRVVSTVNDAKRDTLLILMSYGLGLRVIELAALKIYQVLNKDESINGTITLVKTKGNKQRTVYLPDPKIDNRIHRAIRDYIEERKAYADRKKRIFSHNQPLFMSKKGVAFDQRTLQRRFADLYKLAGIHGASSHSGRRTFATKLIESGVDLKSISTLMGHNSVAMTAVYVEDNPERLKKISSLTLNYL